MRGIFKQFSKSGGPLTERDGPRPLAFIRPAELHALARDVSLATQVVTLTLTLTLNLLLPLTLTLTLSQVARAIREREAASRIAELGWEEYDRERARLP